METSIVVDLFQAIAKRRHLGWYRAACAGACPHQGARRCVFVDMWSNQVRSLTATQLVGLRSRLQEQFVVRGGCRCCAVTTDTSSPPLSGLCALHHRQVAWRNYGASCRDMCCAKYTWPTKEQAPLLYLAHTTPSQAVVLLHFGLYSEEDVYTLITNYVEVAILVAHLIHHKGTIVW